jgi:hypothetical protein
MTMTRILRTTQAAVPKDKKSFTISRQSVEFLELMRRKRKARAVSAVLEEILQAARREQERQDANLAVTAFYDSLSDDEVKEEAAWGQFALDQLPQEIR